MPLPARQGAYWSKRNHLPSIGWGAQLSAHQGMCGILMATAIGLEMADDFFGPTGNKRKLAKGFGNSNKLSLKSWLLERVSLSWSCVHVRPGTAVTISPLLSMWQSRWPKYRDREQPRLSCCWSSGPQWYQPLNPWIVWALRVTLSMAYSSRTAMDNPNLHIVKSGLKDL